MTTMQPQPEKTQDEQHSSPRVKRRRTLIALGAGALVLFAIAMALFQPWLIFVNTEVNDDIPTIASQKKASTPASQTPQSSAPADAMSSAVPQSGTTPAPETPASPAPAPAEEQAADAGPTLVAQGSLISHEHETSGNVSVFRLPDGSHQLALEGLETTTGPDVHIWLSQAPVIEGFDGWFTAANYDHLDLGELKGNRGNQVYTIPADVNIADWSSITLWCEAFSVSFGAAELTPVQ